MEVYNKQLLYFKINFFLKKMRSKNFFEEKNYNELLKLLCNRKKVRIFKIFIYDLFYLLEKEKIIKKIELNNKVIKILFISLYINNSNFNKIILNNNTEFNQNLIVISNNITVNIKIINNSIFKLTYLGFKFIEFLEIYNKWEIIDKKINTQKLLLDYFEISITENTCENDIIKSAYKNELTKIEDNVKYLNDSTMVEYFDNMKTNYDNYQLIQEELYWQNIKYEISCEDKYKYTILKLIEKTKKMFIDCVPKNLVMQNEIHENLDIQILSNMMTKQNKSDFIDFKYLEGKLFYILDVLKRFQSPNSDESYELWCNNIKKRMENKIYYKDLIPYFFKELFDRIIIILEEIKKFKENILI